MRVTIRREKIGKREGVGEILKESREESETQKFIA
jgi:hypothetical protein